MEPELLTAFIELAEAQIPGIRSGILVCIESSESTGELYGPVRLTRSIKTSAEEIGLDEMASAVAPLEATLTSMLEGREAFSDLTLRKALDEVAKIEELLSQLRQIADESEIDVAEFVETSFDNLGIGSSLSTDSPVAEYNDSADDSEFEIDEEMMEIFGAEAEGLLANIEVSLEALTIDPSNMDALWEIRRNAHTFKGAAGIVGLKKPSELAHRVEDLLDRLAEKNGNSSSKLVALLKRSLECMRSLTNGDISPAVTAKISVLHKDFDGALNAISGKTESAQPPSSIPAFKEDIDPIPQSAAETSPQVRSGSIVRVSLVRLDELGAIIRDLVVSRATFDQRLADLDEQIEELRHATYRLRSTSGKIESDFEANMLGDRSTNFVRESSFGRGFPVEDDSFDPLEMDLYTDFHQSARELTETASDAFEINSELDALRTNLETLFERQRRSIEDLQEKLIHIRMVEFGSLKTRLQRAVRVTCDEEKKEAEVILQNGNIEVDTQILDSLIEPLMHLLRNAVVHGIETPDKRRLLGKPETGRITINVSNEETHIVLAVSDDGRGIATSRLRDKALQTGIISDERAQKITEDELVDLIFEPGLTTADKLNLSAGRGVGMSIVKESVESRRGTVSVDSTPQSGTTFRIRMPLKIAVTKALIIKSHRRKFAVPANIVKHISDLGQLTQKTVGKERFVEMGSGKFQLVSLSDHLGLQIDETCPAETSLLFIDSGGKNFAVEVDEVVKTEEIAIRSLGMPLDDLNGLLGAAIIGSGEVVPILDLPYLIGRRPSVQKQSKTEPETTKLSVLIVDDSPSVRHMTSKVLTKAGIEVFTARDGVEAMDLLLATRRLPEVVITDIEMPRMDGYDLVASMQANEHLRELPVIVITSRTGEKHRVKAFETGISEYLSKPFEDAVLLETVMKYALIPATSA